MRAAIKSHSDIIYAIQTHCRNKQTILELTWKQYSVSYPLIHTMFTMQRQHQQQKTEIVLKLYSSSLLVHIPLFHH